MAPSNEPPLVSIIIPTYNRPDSLAKCLAGMQALLNVKGKKKRFSFEIVVVNDGSIADPAEMLTALFAKLPIQWLNQKNLGPAAARNRGARAANGRFYLFTDDDCVPEPDWVRQMVFALRQRPLTLVGGRTINGLPQNVFAEASQSLIDYLYSYFKCRDGRFFTSNNFGVQGTLFWQVGGFNETMKLAAGEDREFCDRWQAQGFPLYFEPAARIKHYHPLSLRSFWRQHFTYGRGARQYHHLRANRAKQGVQLEPLSFYGRLILWPLLGKRPFSFRNLLLIPLMALSQLANAVGYFIDQ